MTTLSTPTDLEPATPTDTKPVVTPPKRVRVSLGHAVKDAWVITRRNLVRSIRIPQLLLVSFLQPIMFLFLFTFVFGGAIGQTIPDAAGGEYINWLMPGLMVQLAAFGSGQTAFGLSEDIGNGVIDRFRSLPMARSGVLAGRTTADLIRNVVTISFMVLVGVPMGFRYQNGFLPLVGGILLAGAFTYAMSWVMASVGLTVKNPEAVQSAVFFPIFPLVFASSVFVPTETMPEWLRAFADNQPITVTTDALRGLILGADALSPGQTTTGMVFLSLVWVAVITLVFAPIAVRIYRRTVSTA